MKINKIALFAAFSFAAIICFAGCSNLFESFLTNDETAKTGDTSLADTGADRSIINKGLVVIKSTVPSRNQIAYTVSQKEYYVGENDYLTTDYTNGTTDCVTNNDTTVTVKCIPNDKHATVTNWTVEEIYSAEWQETTKSDTFIKLETGASVSYLVEKNSDNKIIIITSDNLPYGTTKVTSTVTADDTYYTETYVVYITKKHSGITLKTSSNTDITHGLVVIKKTEPTINQITPTEGQNAYCVGTDVNVITDNTNGSEINLCEADDPELFKCYLPDANSSITWSVIQTHEDVVTSTSSSTTEVVSVGGTNYTYTKTTYTTTETITSLPTPNDYTGRIAYTNSEGGTAGSSNAGAASNTVNTIGTKEFMTIDLPYGVTVVTATVKTDDGSYTNEYKITLIKKHVTFTESGETVSPARLTGLTITPINDTGSDTPSNTLSPEFTPGTFIYTYKVDEFTDELELVPTGENGVTVSNVTIKNKKGTNPDAPYTTGVMLPNEDCEIDVTVTKDGYTSTYYIFVDKTDVGDTALATLIPINATTEKTGVAGGLSSINLNTADQGRADATSAAGTTNAKGEYELFASADNRVDVTSIKFTATPKIKYNTIDYAVVDGDAYTLDPQSVTWESLYTNSSVSSASLSPKDTSKFNYKTIWFRVTTRKYMHTIGDTEKTADVAYHVVKVTKPGTGNYNLTALKVATAYEQNYEIDNSLYDNLSEASGTVYKTIESGYTIEKDVDTYLDQITLYFRTLDKIGNDATTNISVTAENTVPDGSGLTKETSTNRETTIKNGADDTYFYLSDVTTEIISGLTYYKCVIGEVNSSSDCKGDIPDSTTTITIKVSGETAAIIKVTKPNQNSSTMDGLGDFIGTGRYGYYKDQEYWIYVGSDVDSQKVSLSTAQTGTALSITSCLKTNEVDGTEVTNNNFVTYNLTAASATTSSDKTHYVLYVGDLNGKTNQNTGNNFTKLPEGTTSTVIKATSANGTAAQNYILHIVKCANTESRLSAFTFGGTTLTDGSAEWTKDTATNTSYTSKVTAPSFSAISATPLDSEATVSIDSYASDTEITSTTINALSDSDWISVSKGTAGKTCDVEAGTYEKEYNVYRITCTAQDNSTKTIYYVYRTYLKDTECSLIALKVAQYVTGNSGTYSLILNKQNISSETSYEYTADETNPNYKGSIIVTPTMTSSYSTIAVTSVEAAGTDKMYSKLQDTAYSTTNTGIVTIAYNEYKSYNYLNVTYSVQAEDTTISPKKYSIVVPTGSFTTVSCSTTLVSEKSYSVGGKSESKYMIAYRFGSYRTDGIYRKIEGTQDYEGIDIIGTCNAKSSKPTWAATAFSLSGWLYCLNIDGTTTWLTVDSNGKVTCGDITLTITPTIAYAGTQTDAVPYLTLKHTVTNNGTKAHTVKLGAMCDTFVDTVENATTTGTHSDGVAIQTTDYGFYMKNAGYYFHMYLKNCVGVDDVTTLWSGEYQTSTGEEAAHVFDSATATSVTDSAADYSWTLGSIAAKGSVSKSIRMSLTDFE